MRNLSKKEFVEEFGITPVNTAEDTEVIVIEREDELDVDTVLTLIGISNDGGAIYSKSVQFRSNTEFVKVIDNIDPTSEEAYEKLIPNYQGKLPKVTMTGGHNYNMPSIVAIKKGNYRTSDNIYRRIYVGGKGNGAEYVFIVQKKSVRHIAHNSIVLPLGRTEKNMTKEEKELMAMCLKNKYKIIQQMPKTFPIHNIAIQKQNPNFHVPEEYVSNAQVFTEYYELVKKQQSVIFKRRIKAKEESKKLKGLYDIMLRKEHTVQAVEELEKVTEQNKIMEGETNER